MKTFIEHLIIVFDTITHPASGWFKTNETQPKRKAKSVLSTNFSPESYNLRGFSKKSANNRRTFAP